MIDDVYKKKFERAEQKVAILERMIETKTREVFLANEHLRAVNQELSELHRMIPGALLLVDANGCICQVNQSAIELLGYPEDLILGWHVRRVCDKADWFLQQVDQPDSKFISKYEDHWVTAKGTSIPMLVSLSILRNSDDGSLRSIVCIGVDLSERKNLEVELRHAQKLEAVGQLAAGVAHEINTPMQFIGDNVHFLRDAFSDVMGLVDALAPLRSLTKNADGVDFLALEQAEERADLEYLKERVPLAFQRTLSGVERVSSIISAMKAFSHPQNDKAPVDLNKAVETTLTVARSEYKYIAEVVTELGDIPMVVCHAGDINQMLLNLIVNAAHAIEAVRDNDGPLGRIALKTQCDEDHVLISISDTGSGIPEEIKHRIFDPFFTTKQVGKGTGQGLSLVHNIVAHKHGGSIVFDSQVGVGTTFFVRLPLNGMSSAKVVAA
jgi:two-component system NtrC family sensor kinase